MRAEAKVRLRAPLLAAALLLPGASWALEATVRRLGPLPLAAPVIGCDAAYSIDLGDGSLWLFGDTFFRARAASMDKVEAVSNSAAFSRSKTPPAGPADMKWISAARGRPKPLLERASSEDAERTRLWPGGGVKLGGDIYLYYSRVDVYGPTAWDFRHAGQGLAVGGAAGRYRRLSNGKTLDFWNEREPRFGAAVLRGRDGFVYLYGREERKPHAFKLARVLVSRIAAPDAYEYYDGEGGWSGSSAGARALFVEGPPEASVSFNRHLGAYLMLYSRLAEGDVVVREGENPWGPWSSPTTIYRCAPGTPEAGCYAAKEHAEYSGAGGKTIYFTLVDGNKLGGAPQVFEATFRSAGR